MSLKKLNETFHLHAQAQNILKRRIGQLEALTAGTMFTYHSVHGLILQLWSETGQIERDPEAQACIVHIRANPPSRGFTAEVQYTAEKLREVRLEVNQKGLLHNGTQGSFDEVAQELVGLLVNLGGCMAR